MDKNRAINRSDTGVETVGRLVIDLRYVRFAASSIVIGQIDVSEAIGPRAACRT
jgi:hypothetical protein